jgi:hypothetical protein
MEHDSLSAMAYDTPSMVKNKIFSIHASRVFNEVQKLNLATVQEREAEYTRRMMELPNHILYPNIPDTSQQTGAVRYTFSMPKSGSIMSSVSSASSASSA